jgi:aryl-alcohol dehydrogenase-like predicted oxidoreductase
MKNNADNKTENKVADPLMRRTFIKAATLLGLGTMASGTANSYANVPPKKPEGIGTILNKKRSLGSKKNPLIVSAIQLGCMGMHTGRTAVQSEYSFMTRLPEDLIFSTLQELEIGFVAYSPLCRGLLGGTLTEYSDLKTNDIRGAWPRFQPEALRANIGIVEALNEFGKTRGMTSSQICIAWMLSKYPFIVPLPGTTKLSHLEEDLRAADFVLTPAEIIEIESTIQKIGVVGDRYDALQQSRVEY